MTIVNNIIKEKIISESKSEKIDLLNKTNNLEDTILRVLQINKNLNWTSLNNNIQLVKTPKEVIEVFKLRSKVYTPMNYNNEFSEEIKGLNYDEYDKNSVIFMSKKDNGEISGTSRIILDNNQRLLSENKYDQDIGFDLIREKYKIGEASRTIINEKYQNNGIEFRNIICSLYSIANQVNIEKIITVIKSEHFKLYEKIGAKIIKEINNYGKLEQKSLILEWDVTKKNKFFEKVFYKRYEN